MTACSALLAFHIVFILLVGFIALEEIDKKRENKKLKLEVIMKNWYREFKTRETQGDEIKWRFHPNKCTKCGEFSIAMLKPVEIIESKNPDVICYKCMGE